MSHKYTATDQGRPGPEDPDIEQNVDNDDDDAVNNANGSSVIYVIDGVGYSTELAATPPSLRRRPELRRGAGDETNRHR